MTLYILIVKCHSHCPSVVAPDFRHINLSQVHMPVTVVALALTDMEHSRKHYQGTYSTHNCK